MRLLGLGGDQTSNDTRLNSAMINATQDLEGAVVAPILIPRIRHKPVLDTTLNAPAKDLDGMTSELRARSVLVNARLVRDEVLVHSEGGLDGTVSHDLLLNGAGHDRVNRLAVILGALDGGLVALGGWLTRTAGLVVSSVDVVFTWGESVGVLILSCETTQLEEAPGRTRIASVAATSTHRSTARQHVLRREFVLDRAVGGNAQSVAHSLNTAKGPARAARRLVTDVPDVRALAPRSPGIEVLGNVHIGGICCGRGRGAACQDLLRIGCRPHDPLRAADQ